VVDDAQKSVLIVDDVDMDVRHYQRGLNLTGAYRVQTAKNPDEALKAAKSNRFDVAVLDLVMPPGILGDLDSDFGEETGYALAARLVREQPHIKIVILSHVNARDKLELGFRERLNIADMLVKRETKPIDLVRSLDQIFGTRSMTPNVFLVHGHNRALVRLAQDIVETELGWTKPVVLDEQAGGAMTIIEKFERFAQSADAVLVLMTPDDIGASVKDISQKQFRARQNVLFELGYFFGKFRREAGRVFVLKTGDLEVPSDLAGIQYIDVSDPDEARRQVAKELRHAFDRIGHGTY
jgi:predicted nucleotide-binding protein